MHVKRTWLVAVLATVVALSSTQAARAQTSTRVAVVNIGVVFTKYDKAKLFKTEMEQLLKPFKDEAEKIKKDILAYKNARDSAKDPKQRDDYDNAMRVLSRRLEDLDIEARKRVGKRQEEHLVQLYKEVTDHIQAVAQANGVHLVLGYGDPPSADLMTFGNVNRKLSNMDMGGLTPLFFHGSLDISETVVTSLNRAFAGGGGAAVTPTGLNK
jgi:Skp family chaperone for outer membrane proteins